MTHIRKSIRDAVVTTVTGLTTTSTRVYKGRNLPLTDAEYPCLCVYARGETYDYGEAAFGNGRAWPQRIVELHVQGYVKDSDASVIEDTLDLIAEEVETALFAAGSLGGALGITLGEQQLSLDPAGNETLGTIDLVFNVMYRTAEGSPGTAI